jgi:hypothetical protein
MYLPFSVHENSCRLYVVLHPGQKMGGEKEIIHPANSFIPLVTFAYINNTKKQTNNGHRRRRRHSSVVIVITTQQPTNAT